MNPTKGAEVSDLTQFLLARIAEDYADAMSGWRWKALPAGEYERLQARVLRECEAKRRIVADHPDYGGYGESCATCADSAEDLRPWPCATMLALASVYAEHADYREEWCP